MKLLTKGQEEFYENAKIFYICKEKNENKFVTNKTYCKFRDNSHYGAHSICSLEYSVPKKSPIAFRIGSNYDYHVTIRN